MTPNWLHDSSIACLSLGGLCALLILQDLVRHLAYAFGIVFQYFAIASMRGLPFGKGIVAAIKADTLSLTAWQIGMYGFMAIAYFAIFKTHFDRELRVDTVEFWFMMQIAMIAGFITAYPVNWWLIRVGIKEAM